MKPRLKLIAVYDAKRHENTLFRHNLNLDEVNEALRELAARLFGLFVVDQHAEHSVTHPDECRACRRDVEMQSHTQPKPKFTRRQQ